MAVLEKSSNQSSTLFSSELWHSNNNGMVSYEVWQKLSNNMPVYFAYYAGIMLEVFGYLLCFYYAGIIGLGLFVSNKNYSKHLNTHNNERHNKHVHA